MEIVIIAAIIALAAVAAVHLILRFKGQATGQGGAAADEAVARLQGEVQALMHAVNSQISGLRSEINSQVAATNSQMFEQLRAQFSESQQLVTSVRDAVRGQLSEVAARVGETQEATRQVFTIADKLNDLQRVLTSQKQRGNLGEAGLALILANTLPPTAYELQYQFANGDRVDAVIKAPEGLIPIDAKFPLENYTRIIDEPDPEKRATYEDAFKRDLRARIDEAGKYVRPKEGTLEIAFMYIPAEAIYYDILVNEVGATKVNTRSLVEYAFNQKRVVIVSPTTLAAYLQTVLMGFKAFKIEREAQAIAKNVEALGRHLNAYQDFFAKIGSSLSTTVNHYNAASKELGKIDKDVLRITGERAGLQIEAVDRPRLPSD